jgi:hypothetical protein
LNDIQRNNTVNIDIQMNKFLKEHEGDMIASDIILLQEMGNDKKIINKIYILLQPENLERAIDLMTQVNGIYQHEFFENHNQEKDKGLCFICKKPKRFHLNYIPENDVDIENDNIDEDEKNNKIDLNVSNDGENICSVCFEEIEKEEKQFNHLSCGHVCCTQCWINYFKALILEAKVEEIKCVEHKCTTIIPESFIMSHIKNDTKLVDKYYKFKKRAEIINDPNKKICPNPDCDSYLQKSNITNYVKCENGHEYCFECLNRPHGNILCDKYIEEEFMDWKKDKRVKRCPRCKIYTEKNEGCNHMTCTSCKYQWCWLCEGEYKYGHYDSGKCRGFQFTKADNLEEAEKVGRDPLLINNYNVYNDRPEINCCFSLHTLFPCIFREIEDANFTENGERYCAIITIWLIGVLGLIGAIFLEYFERKNLRENIFVFLIPLCLFVAYQIIFTCLITPFILISLFYPYFIDRIFMFFGMDY